MNTKTFTTLRAAAFSFTLPVCLATQMLAPAAFAADAADQPALKPLSAKEDKGAVLQVSKDAPAPVLDAAKEQDAGAQNNSSAGALNNQDSAAVLDGTAPKMLLKPGQSLSVGMETEDIVATGDVNRARAQSIAYPTSPEAAFIYAVALTRTSRVEEALQEVKRAKRLAAGQGGAVYFDKMIATYEHMLEYYPDDNQVRYDLAWAYYMKAYLLSKSAPAPKPLPEALKAQEKGKKIDADKANQVLSMLSPQIANANPSNQSGKVTTNELPHIPSALELAAPSVVPQVKQYYEAALKNLDDLLARNPSDVWAKVYRAHLNAEYTGDLKGAMQVWKQVQAEAPQNPAPYFFLGEGYLREGNLKECLNHISRAIALRAIGN